LIPKLWAGERAYAGCGYQFSVIVGQIAHGAILDDYITLFPELKDKYPTDQLNAFVDDIANTEVDLDRERGLFHLRRSQKSA
jgi:hypothetical protein